MQKLPLGERVLRCLLAAIAPDSNRVESRLLRLVRFSQSRFNRVRPKRFVATVVILLDLSDSGLDQVDRFSCQGGTEVGIVLDQLPALGRKGDTMRQSIVHLVSSDFVQVAFELVRIRAGTRVMPVEREPLALAGDVALTRRENGTGRRAHGDRSREKGREPGATRDHRTAVPASFSRACFAACTML